MALLGRQVLIEYDVGGPRIWHERYPLEHLEGDNYVILTPDGDVYSEELGPLNADVRSIRVRPAAGVAPAGMRPASIYAMPAWTANELATHRDEARRVADQERRGAAPMVAPPVQAAMAVAQPGIMAVDFAAGTLKWLAAESKGSYVFGQEVAGIGLAMARGFKAVHQTGEGPLFVECVEGADFAVFKQRPAMCDNRLLPSFLNTLGQPERTLKDVAAASVEYPESAWRDCDRDVFPLQLIQEFESSSGASRKCRQRAGRRRHLVDECNNTIGALNRMYGRPSGPNFFGRPSEKSPSLAQSKTSEFVLQATKSLGPPPDFSGPEALCALRVSEGYESLPSSSPLGAYDPAKVSLPAEGMQPVPLASLWGSGGQQQVEHFSQQHLLQPDLVQHRLADSGVQRCYQDPQFNNVGTYASFLQKLHGLSLIEFSTQPSKEQVGIFFVKKKGDRLRLILDCRRSNCHFSDPDPIHLATGEAMGRMHLLPNETLHTVSADLQNAFYTMEMPENLRPYFGLRRVRAQQLSVSEVGGETVDGSTWIYPRVKVIPMGWSWAMWWCQTLSERICERGGLLPNERLRDHAPAPKGSFWHIQYVDNLHVFGANQTEVEQRFWKAVEALREAGLVVHEIEVGDQDAAVLGWNVTSDAVLKPKAARLWRLRLAIREILRRGRASGQQLERLIGHITFVSLCKREALSVLGESYTFFRRHYTQVVPLWKSVRKELMNWDGIAPLIFCRLDANWGDTMYAVDASEWGLGVTTSSIGDDEACGLWSYNERWRFKHGMASNPRQFVQVEEEHLAYVEQGLDTGPQQLVGVQVTWDHNTKKRKRAPDPNPSRALDLPTARPLTWDIEMSSASSSKKKQMRSRRRSQQSVQAPARSLAQASVSAQTLRKYQELWARLHAWASRPMANHMESEDLDRLLTQYLEVLYLDGSDLSAANYLVAAAVFHVPSAKGQLPLTQQSLKGWRKLCPPRARMPIPYEVACLLSQLAVQQNKIQIALVIQLAFLLYLRPSEPFKLRVQDIVPPMKRAGKSYRHYSILLHPHEEGIPSKTMQWDEMMSLDLPHMKFLGAALTKHLCLLQRSKNDLAFKVTMDDVNKFMEDSMDGTLRAFNVSQPWDNELPGSPSMARGGGEHPRTAGLVVNGWGDNHSSGH
eukprot:Skav209719  [mRNA]  locus=scaffold528:209114:215555:- [translate_table: standard]